MLTTVGLRTDANGGLQLGSLLVKLLFTLTLIGVGSAMLAKLIYPVKTPETSMFSSFLHL